MKKKDETRASDDEPWTWNTAHIAVGAGAARVVAACAARARERVELALRAHVRLGARAARRVDLQRAPLVVLPHRDRVRAGSDEKTPRRRSRVCAWASARVCVSARQSDRTLSGRKKRCT